MRRWLFAFPLLLVLAVSTPATTLIPMYLDDLTSQSQTVAYGTVVASRVEWDASHRWIFTVYTIQPAQYLKGNLGSAFELREPGGELDGIGMKVAGVPQFKVGQEAVFFVWTDTKGFHQVTGFEQGAVLIKTDPATGAKTAGRPISLGTAETTTLASTIPPSTSRALLRLLDEIRVSVARSSQGRANE